MKRLRPGSFVPAVADDHVCIGMMPGVGCDPLHGVVPAPCIVQAKTCDDLAGLDQMHMGIDKGGRNQPIVKINFGLPRRCPSGRLIVADEANDTSVGHDSGRPWEARSVHTSPDKDHESVRDESVLGQI